MKKHYKLIAGVTLVIASSAQSFAQFSPLCGGIRFHDYMFSGVPTPTSGVVYGSNLTYSGATQSLLMDIYQPVGDTASKRPLIIIAHGGSFVQGSRTGGDVVPLAQNFAEMGYVTASIDYRLLMTNLTTGPDSADAGAAVMRGVQDGRAAVRFFRKNARVGGNTYKIDTNHIYFVGVSAGAFIAIHIAYMNLLSDFPSYIDTTGVTQGSTTGQPGLHGGIEGLSGNPGYPSNVNAIIDICGAIADTNMMHPGAIPILSFHGNADGTVPYGYAEIYLAPPTTFPLLKVYGSSMVTLRATHLGIPNCMETWLGQGHVPETTSAAYYDSTITISRTWLEHFTCGTALNCSYTQPLGVNELTKNTDFNIYPNPANTYSTVELSAFTGKSVNIELYDALGRRIVNVENLKAEKYVLDRNNMPTGIYFIKVSSEGKNYCKKLIFE